MHIIKNKNKRNSEGMGRANLVGPKALIALHRRDETRYHHTHHHHHQQLSSLEGSGGGRETDGRREVDPKKLAPCLAWLPYGGACGRILYLPGKERLRI